MADGQGYLDATVQEQFLFIKNRWAMLTSVGSGRLPTHLTLSLALEYLAPELKRTKGPA